MSYTLLVNIVGWIGTLLVLGAYYLITSKKIKSSSRLFQSMNLFGAIGLILNGYYYTAYPSVGLNLVWIAIAAYGLIMSKKS